MTKRQALALVKSLSKAIDKSELDLDAWKWERAEAMADASEAGATLREIAAAAGFAANNTSSVRRHIAVWTESGTLSHRPSYTEAYDMVTGFDRDAAQKRTDQARARRVLQDSEQREKLLRSMSDSELNELTQDAIQTHSATAKKPPMGLPEPRKYGFLMEMMRPHSKLVSAIDLYVKTWEENAEGTDEEILQNERDLMAPHIFKLRATAEEVSLT